MKMKFDKIIVDGRHVLWRTTDAFRDLHVELDDGSTIPTGGIYGTLGILIRIHARYGGAIVFAWEGAGNFRERIFQGYKGRDRPIEPERASLVSEMSNQERILVALLSDLGIAQFKGKGCEADDVIGRLVNEAADNGEKCVIYSGDSDLRQLVNEHVWVACPGKGKDELFDIDGVTIRYGLPPSQIPELKALAGDSSDKIPGAPGIGAVTATKLLRHYGTLKAVVEAARREDKSWPETPRRRAIIAAAGDDVMKYLQLTTIRTDLAWVAVNHVAHPQQADVLAHLQLLKFRSMALPSELAALMRLGRRL